METIRKWTNPAQKVIVKGENLTGAEKVFVTFRQADKVLTIENPPSSYEDEDTTLFVSLTQEQTGMFSAAFVSVQVNWMIGGYRYATNIVPVRITPNLLEENIDVEVQ